MKKQAEVNKGYYLDENQQTSCNMIIHLQIFIQTEETCISLAQ